MDLSHPVNFRDLYLSDELIQALDAIHYTRPTPVQAATIPLTLAGIDLIVQSQTGTGKTAAFAIPVLELLDPAPGRVEVLVLAPTRELAKQVCDEFERLSKFKRLSTAAIYGGASYGPQIAALQDAQVVCATPGRLLDLLKQDKISLKDLRFFILDEADEMLSMGFERDLTAILDYLPEERQSLLFSATVSDDIQGLANRILFYPEFVSLSNDSVGNADVEHSFYSVSGTGRSRDLVRIIEHQDPETAIIFANTKSDTFLVSSFLQRHGYAADLLNGDLPQADREKTLAALRDGKLRFLVATDVAARGIDISDLSHVINYTLPDAPEVYVHRTGRTGRAGKKGHAISLVSPREIAVSLLIQKHYGIKFVERPLPSTRDIVSKKQAQAVAQLDAQLAHVNQLQYAPLIGLAKRILTPSPEQDHTHLLAKLLSIATRAHDTQPTYGIQPIDAPVAIDAAPIQENLEAEVEIVEEHPPPAPAVVVAQAAPGAAPAAPVDEIEPLEPLFIEEDEEPAPTRTSSAGTSDEESRRRGRGRGRGRDDRRGRNGREERPKRAEAVVEEVFVKPKPAPVPVAMSKVYINLGRPSFATSEAMQEWLAFMTGLDAPDFGNLEADRTSTIFEVRQDLLYDVIGALNGQDWEGKLLNVRPYRPR